MKNQIHYTNVFLFLASEKLENKIVSQTDVKYVFYRSSLAIVI